MLTVEEVREILRQVRYQNWHFFVAGKAAEPTVPDYLQVKFTAPCTTTGEDSSWSGRKWQLSRWMTRSEIVMTAFKAVLTAVEHEARESFLYKGQPIFGPHVNVDMLAQIYASRGEEVLDVRLTIEQEKNETGITQRTDRATA